MVVQFDGLYTSINEQWIEDWRVLNIPASLFAQKSTRSVRSTEKEGLGGVFNALVDHSVKTMSVNINERNLTPSESKKNQVVVAVLYFVRVVKEKGGGTTSLESHRLEVLPDPVEA